MKQTRHRMTFEERIARAKTLVQSIQSRRPSDNDTAVIVYLADRVPVDSIIPRVTVLPFDAWLAFGRHVKKGETGTRIGTYVPVIRRDENGTPQKVTRTTSSGEERVALRPADAIVFHIAQTAAYDRPHPDFWSLTPEMDAALRLCIDRQDSTTSTTEPADETATDAPALPVTIYYGSTPIHSTATETDDEARPAVVIARRDTNGRRPPGDMPLFANRP